VNISAFDYQLPDNLIAQEPLAERDASRMLIVDRATQSWRDSHFNELPQQLSAGDLLVLNNTRVFAARLRGKRVPFGGSIELLLARELEPNVWEALARPARRLRIGDRIDFANGALHGYVADSFDNGLRVIKFETNESLDDLIDRIGEPPLPPYISRVTQPTDDDRNRYQTVYATERGAIAAPTAGLHFTAQTFATLKARGIEIAEITLHVGYGTFEPVRVAEVSKHKVAAERFSISEETAGRINDARAHGKRIIGVGTTTARALESAAGKTGVKAQSGLASLTILPGYEFRIINGLLTNFHLPKSSLLMLVSAFAGRELVLRAYQHAVAQHYRFYSYGDCMLLL
jgi:S-adenosylmethionine:tRNA ribosyltransferase-isomerase